VVWDIGDKLMFEDACNLQTKYVSRVGLVLVWMASLVHILTGGSPSSVVRILLVSGIIIGFIAAMIYIIWGKDYQ
jgi:hypothetical protein